MRASAGPAFQSLPLFGYEDSSDEDDDHQFSLVCLQPTYVAFQRQGRVFVTIHFFVVVVHRDKYDLLDLGVSQFLL